MRVGPAALLASFLAIPVGRAALPASLFVVPVGRTAVRASFLAIPVGRTALLASFLAIPVGRAALLASCLPESRAVWLPGLLRTNTRVSRMTYSPHRTRLVLQLGFDGSPVPAADIRAWLAAGDIACAILTVSGPLDRDGRDALKTCVTDFQDGDVAVLIADDPELAQEVKSDGVHLSARPDIVEVYSALREARSSDWIIGTEPGDERHTAMTLGEAGADYLAFHLPAQKDQALWWAEVFEVPAIAAGPDVAAAAELAGARIEFVAVPGEVSAIEAMETILTAAPMVSA